MINHHTSVGFVYCLLGLGSYPLTPYTNGLSCGGHQVKPSQTLCAFCRSWTYVAMHL